MYKILHIPSGFFIRQETSFGISGKGHTSYYFNHNNFGNKTEAVFFFKWTTAFLLWRKVPKKFRAEYEIVDVTPNRNYN